MVVASGAPAGAWQISLDESGDAYVATLTSAGAHQAHLAVRLPRRLVDEAVLASAGIALELTPEARVAAYAESTARTLVATTLRALIAQAVAPEQLSGAEAAAALGRLEAELIGALETVRQARVS
jgi:hypothetical protein